MAPLHAPLDATAALSGEVRLESSTQGKLQRGRAYFALRAPEHLLIELVTPSDDTVAVLVMTPDRFATWERSDNRCHTGKPCAANVARVLPIWMDGAGVVRLLLGRPPLIAGTRGPVRRQEHPPRLLLSISGRAGLRQELAFSADGRDLLRSRIWRAEVLRSEVRYARYAGAPGGRRLPRRIVIEHPRSKSRVTIRVEALEPLVERPRTFADPCPAGAHSSEEPCAER